MTATFPLPSQRVSPTLPLRRFTVDEYHRMIRDGYFANDERFELLEGLIVEKMSKNPPHEAVVANARRILDRRLPPDWHIRVQSSLTTTDSEPEPDLAIVRGSELDYFGRHPGSGDAALIVEVSDSTLTDDQTIKYRIYAKALIGVYWIVNIPGQRIHVYETPSGPAATPSYAKHGEFVPGQAVRLTVGGVQMGPIPVSDFFNKAP